MDEGLEMLLTEIRTAVGGIAETTLEEKTDVSGVALDRELSYLESEGLIESREGDHVTYWEATDDA
jgi:DNA-binding IscR family transcriptional regulator